jgi:hypothetical protein
MPMLYNSTVYRYVTYINLHVLGSVILRNGPDQSVGSIKLQWNEQAKLILLRIKR